MNDTSNALVETAEDSLESAEGSNVLNSMVKAALQVVSATTMGAAILSAVLVLSLHIPAIHALLRNLPSWCLKSAVPLILVGVSYASLLFSVERTAAQRLLGLLVCIAFVGWGVEQFVSDATIVSLIDDTVVFLFVLDLSLVIREHLMTHST